MDSKPAARYAIVGAGPSGLAGARNLSRFGLDFDGFERGSSVGGLWNIDNPRSTMYESAHLISSRTTTEFTEFPMPEGTPDYPGHRALSSYFSAFAEHFDLTKHFRFNTEVTSIERVDEGWKVSWRAVKGAKGTGAGKGAAKGQTGSAIYAGVILANGTLAEPSIPSFPGTFDGELLHSSQYKSAEVFHGKRVLIIGAGNSGCDIAVDAVHHAASIDLSVRRGYYFVPRYLFGRPTDTLNQGRPLPARLKQAFDSRLLKLFTGDPVRFGFPKPDYRIYESHPIVNTLVLQHLGQGDLRIRPGIDRFDGHTVQFTDGTRSDYDLVMLATGYVLDYPFVDKRHLNWTGMAPKLFLNIFGSDSAGDNDPASGNDRAGGGDFNGIYVLGMVEASGLGWQGRYEQAELLARYLAADRATQRDFEAVATKPWPDLTGGYRYLALERMSFYVNKDAYRRELKKSIRQLKT